MEREYNYDVAFSFLQEDEPLASRLNDLLSSTLTTFLYSERQAKVAGTDGEKTFNRVFGSEARVVVILYRKAWGNTRWTRIEATAIRNRAYEEGYDFTIFVSLDGTQLPDYVPRTRIWVGLDRWGEQGAASVIEARVQQSGGTPREETLPEKAARLARGADEQASTKKFLDSEAGVQVAKDEVEKTFAEVEVTVGQIDSAASSLNLSLDREWPAVVVRCGSKSMLFSWDLQWANSLNGSGLHVWLFHGYYPLHGIKLSEPRELQTWVLHLDRSEGSIGWREAAHTPLLRPKQVAEKFLSVLIERAKS